MAKNSITDYSKTASLNTDIQSVDIDEGCLPSGINNAIREIMADLAAVNDGTVSLTSPAFSSVNIDAGTIDGTVIGGTTPAAGTFTSGTFTGDVSFGDNDKAIFGAGSDLQIFHNSANGNSIIKEQGGGILTFQTNGSEISFYDTANAATMASFSTGGPVVLRHNGSNKFATTATGIDVTGTVTANGLTIKNEGETITFETSGNATATIKAGDAVSTNSLQIEADNTITLNSGQDDTGGSSDNVIISRGSTYTKTALFDANGDISFYEDTGTTAKFFWDASAESLGIGTTSPASYAKLTLQGNGTETIPTDSLVQSNDSSTLQTIWNSDNAAKYSGIKLETRTSGASGWLIANEWKSTYLGDLVFRGRNGASSSAERMRIDSSGNVGIGTNLPQESIHTAGNIRFGDTAPAELYTNSSELRLGVDRNNDNGTSNITFYVDNSERMRIDSSGRVGIGTTSLGMPLSVRGVSDVYDDFLRLDNNKYGSTNTSGETGILFGWSNHAAASIRAYKDGAVNRTGFIFNTEVGFNTPVEVMRIDSNGNVGIGTSSPTESIHTTGNIRFGDTAPAELYTNSSELRLGVDRNNDNGTSNITFYVDNSERVRIDSSGRVGIGTSSPIANLDVRSASQIRQQYTGSSNGFLIGQFNSSGDASINNQANANLLFATNNAERMRIDSSGGLLLNVTAKNANSQAAIKASSTIALQTQPTSDGYYPLFIYNAAGGQRGYIYNNGTTTQYNTTSDYRLKENVTGIPDGIERIKQLKPSRFNFIEDPDTTFDGFLAHEAQAVVPEAVHGEYNGVDENGEPFYQGIDQSKLVPLLTAALQEAITKIEDLEARVATLEGN